MTDGRKATVVLNYLEECDSTTVVNILSECADDYQLAMVYDRMKSEGIDLPDDGDDDEDED